MGQMTSSVTALKDSGKLTTSTASAIMIVHNVHRDSFLNIPLPRDQHSISDVTKWRYGAYLKELSAASNTANEIVIYLKISLQPKCVTSQCC